VYIARPETDGIVTCFSFETGKVTVLHDVAFAAADLGRRLGVDQASVVLREPAHPYRRDLFGHGIYQAPISLYLEIASECNLGCAHCFKGQSDYGRTLTLAETLRVIDEAADLGVFQLRLVGFEPTISPFFDEVVRHGHERGLYLVLNTSAYYPAALRRKVFGLGFQEFLVSVDGNRADHDAIRRKGSYDRVLAFLEEFRERREACQLDARVKLNMTVSDATIDSMSQVAELAAVYGTDVNFIPYRCLGSGRDNGLRLTPGGLRRLSQTVGELRRQYPAGRVFQPYFDFDGAEDQRYHGIDMCTPCVGAKNLSILANGQVYPCDLLRSETADLFCFGNVLESSLADLWYDSAFADRFRALDKDLCQGCAFYGQVCSGGCTAETYYTHNFYVDPLCPVRTSVPVPRERYDEVYYQAGVAAGVSCYEDYRYLPERSAAEADELIALFGRYAPRRVRSIVDFGCAYGFLIRELAGRGYRAVGVESAAHPARMAAARGSTVVRSLAEVPDGFDALIALNCFEHLNERDLDAVLEAVRAQRAMVAVVVPLAHHDGGSYIDPECNRDAGHFLRRSDQFWLGRLRRYFDRVERVTDGCAQLLHRPGAAVFVAA